MTSAVFRHAVLVLSAVSLTTAFTIRATIDEVTIRRGEQLQLSCEIGLEAGDTLSDLQEVRWYRGSALTTAYGALDVSSCNIGIYQCNNATTVDDRGTVHYAVTGSNTGKMALIISSAIVEDNGTFYCGFLPDFGQSAEISVTVQYLPGKTYPMCVICSYQTVTSGLNSYLVNTASGFTGVDNLGQFI